DLGVGFAENIQHALGGELSRDLLPDDVAQLRLGDVHPNPQLRLKLRLSQAVGEDEHPVDGDLHRDDVIDMRDVATRGLRTTHGHIVSTCPSSAPPIASSIWS